MENQPTIIRIQPRYRVRTARRCTIAVMAALVGLFAAGGSVIADESPAPRGPVKAFLLIGQSNMNGRGNIKTLDEKLTKDLPDRYPPKLMKMRSDVWLVGANGDGISEQTEQHKLEPGFGQWKWYGPELGFGHLAGEHYDEQVLIIKVFGGGTALGKHWVSPSIAKRTGRPVGEMYQRLIGESSNWLANLKQYYPDYDETQGVQLCGVLWIQGHADGGKLRDEYEDNLVDLIRDVREDLGVADMPFVAGESLAGKPKGEAYTNAVARVNEKAGNEQAVALQTKSKIDLMSDAYKPYNSAGDTTHWRHNSRAYLDAGYWGFELMLPRIAASTNHAADKALVAKWRANVEKYPPKKK